MLLQAGVEEAVQQAVNDLGATEDVRAWAAKVLVGCSNEAGVARDGSPATAKA